MPSSGEEDATHTQEPSPAPKPNAFTPLPPLVFIVAGLLVVFLGGWWLGRVTAPEDIREVRGVVTYESSPTVCIAPTMDADIDDMDCQWPVPRPDEPLPAVGTRVVAGRTEIPSWNDVAGTGAWLYIFPDPDE